MMESDPNQGVERPNQAAVAPARQPAPMRVRWLLPAKTPWVTYIFLASTILVYIAQYAASYFWKVDWPAQWGAKINEAIRAGEIWRLITPIWLHASLTHILFNMYALFILGPGLERQLGTWRFLTLYLLSGFGGNVLSFVLSANVSLGASTAIFGLIATQAVFLLTNRKLLGKRANAMLINTVLVIVINLALGFMPQIDMWGHLGGLLAGLAFSWFSGPILKAENIENEIVISDRRDKKRYLIIGLGVFVALSAISIIGFLQ